MENKNFRIIFILKEINLDPTIIETTSIKVTISNNTKLQPVKSSEGIIIDVNAITPGSKIEIALLKEDGQIYGNGEFKIPDSIYTNKEVESEENISIQIDNKESNQCISAKIIVVFLNKNIFKEKNKLKNTKSKADTTFSNSTQNPKSPVKSELNSERSLNKQAININTNTNASSNTNNNNTSTLIKKSVARPKPEEDSFKTYVENIVDKLAFDSKNTNNTANNNNNNNNNTNNNDSIKLELDGSIRAERQDTISSNNEIKIGLGELHSTIIQEGDSRLDERFSAGAKDQVISRQSSKNGFSSPKMPISIASPNASPSLLRDNKLEANTNVYNSPSLKKMNEVLAWEAETKKNTCDRAQIEYLKNIIVGLDAKMKDYQILKNENDQLRIELQKSEESRTELQQSILETTHEMREEVERNQKQVTILLAEKNAALESNKELLKKVDDLNQKVLKLENNKLKLENEVIEQKLKLNIFSDMKVLLDKSYSQNELLEKKRLEEQNQYLEKVKEFEKLLEESKMAIMNVAKEKNKLIDELYDLNTKFNYERKANTDAQNELIILKKKLQTAEGLNVVVANLQAEKDNLTKRIEESRSDQQSCMNQTQMIREEMSARLREIELKDKAYIDQINLLNKKISLLEEKNLSQTGIINEQLKSISELKSTVSTIEQLLCIKEDVNKQLDSANKRLQETYSEKNTLSDQIDKLTRSQNLAVNKTLDLEKVIITIKHTLSEKEETIVNLKKMILDMRDRSPFYTPVTDDPLDIGLANYINNSKDVAQLRYLFIRESDGIYQFGSRKVFAKMEGDKIFMRVGGGFLTIDNFLELNIPIEIEKLAKTDPTKTTTNTLPSQKIHSGRYSLKPQTPNQANKSLTSSGIIQKFQGF